MHTTRGKYTADVKTKAIDQPTVLSVLYSMVSAQQISLLSFCLQTLPKMTPL